MKHPRQEYLYFSAMLVSSQFISFLLGVIKNKIFAVYLGPSGLGILSAFSSSLEFVTQIVGLGLSSAIVRETAANLNKNIDLQGRINTIKSLTLVQAVIASLFVFFFADRLSIFTFGTTQYSLEFQILAVALFMMMFSKTNTSIIEGLLVIKSSSTQIITSSLLVTGLTSIFAILLGARATVLIILGSVSINFLVSHFIQRSSLLKKGIKDFILSFDNISGFFSLGFTMFTGGLISAGTEYFSRIFIIKMHGLVALGYIQAAQTIAFFFVGFILSVIVKIYFPKMVASLDDHQVIQDLLNSQIETGVLVLSPLLLLTAVSSPFIIDIMYSKTFSAGVPVLRFLLIVALLKITSWPLSYFLVSKNDWRTYLWSEVISNSIFIVTLYLTSPLSGIISIGLAGIGQYSSYLVFLLISIRKKHNLSINRELAGFLSLYLTVLPLLILTFSFELSGLIYFCALLIASVVSLYSINKLAILFFERNLTGLLREIVR